jgi:serine protease
MRRSSSPAAGIREISLKPGVSVASAIRRLARARGVAWAVPDYIAHAAGDSAPTELKNAFTSPPSWGFSNALTLPPPFIPNDPGNTGTAEGWESLQWNFVGPFGVNASQAWANLIADGRTGGAGVTVAVLDTGIAYAHHGRFIRSPDFSPYEFVHGYDFVSNSSYPEDRNGHGTQVAGTIAEETNNGIGVTGLAYGVRLMPVRVLNSQGDGDAVTIAEGIRFAVKHHAQIINLSLEFNAGTITASDIPELISAINYAYRKNVLVVAAAGNEGTNELSYPAKAHNALAVGATTESGCLGDYSNFGPGLAIVAPGGGPNATIAGDPNCTTAGPDADIYQETFAGLNYPNVRHFALPGGYFGTSMAAPHVSAIAALVIASGVLGPHPTVAAIIARLESTATPLGAGGNDPYHYGAGLVNAAAATAPIGSTGSTGTTGSTGGSGASGSTG